MSQAECSNVRPRIALDVLNLLFYSLELNHLGSAATSRSMYIIPSMGWGTTCYVVRVPIGTAPRFQVPQFLALNVEHIRVVPLHKLSGICPSSWPRHCLQHEFLMGPHRIYVCVFLHILAFAYSKALLPTAAQNSFPPR